MTEIEQLRADIATLEAAEAVFARKYGQTYQRYNIELDMIRKQLARLEKEAEDPWREAKAAIPLHLANGGHNVKAVAEYARHLEAQVVELEEEVRCERIDGGKVHADQKTRIAELEAELLVSQNELAKRPVVWCTRDYNGDIVKVKHGNLSYTLVFPTKEIANKVSDGGAEIYMGEQK